MEVDSDIVTMVPMVIGMYRHAGTPVVIDSDESGEWNMGDMAYLSC